jgi:hypothetical protein
MRDASSHEKRILPFFPREEQPQWQKRRDRTFLYPGYDDAIENAVARPFEQEVRVTYKGTLDPRLEALIKDVDGTGRSLTEFAKEGFDSGQDDGVTHFIVDMTNSPENASKATKATPRFIKVDADKVPGWVGGRDAATGDRRAQELRIVEDSVLRIGFQECAVKRVRHYENAVWRLYAKNADGEWAIEDEGVNELGKVPHVPYYVRRTGFLTGKPAFWRLAETNLCHWQSSSDHRNYLTFIRGTTLKGTGFKKKELEHLTMGPWRMFVVPSGGDVNFMEHKGAAFNSSFQDLEMLKQEMRHLSVQPLLEQMSGDPKATGQGIAEAKAQALIVSWIRNLEMALLQCFELAAEWLGVKLPADFKVNIFDEFTIALKGQGDLVELREDYDRTVITPTTYLKERQKRGLYGVDLDPEREWQDARNLNAGMGEDTDDDDEVEDVGKGEVEVEEEEVEDAAV